MDKIINFVGQIQKYNKQIKLVHWTTIQSVLMTSLP